MADTTKYKSLNVDLTTHYYLRMLAAETKRSIVSVVRGMAVGISVPAFTALERANTKRLDAAHEERT